MKFSENVEISVNEGSVVLSRTLSHPGAWHVPVVTPR